MVALKSMALCMTCASNVEAFCGSSASQLSATQRTSPTMMAKSKVAPMFDAPEQLKGFVGEEDGFDPLKLSTQFDMKWLREAEIKHGRMSMLAWLGFVMTDVGFKLPGEAYSLASIDAGKASLSGPYGGPMGQIFLFIGLAELLTNVPAINYTMNGGDRQPGDFAFDPLGYLKGASPEAKEEMQLKELKNGRLAMLAFGGVVTQAALGHPNFPYVG